MGLAGLARRGLATIDPHIVESAYQALQNPKFGVNRPKSKQDTAI